MIVLTQDLIDSTEFPGCSGFDLTGIFGNRKFRPPWVAATRAGRPTWMWADRHAGRNVQRTRFSRAVSGGSPRTVGELVGKEAARCGDLTQDASKPSRPSRR